MNGDKSDASTSTDDVKDRPLCLFYFTHPFGVLSPEPPIVTAAPLSVTRAFLNMEPISPFYWPASVVPTATTTEESYRSTSPSTMNYDLGDATVHHNPVSVISVARTRRCTMELPRRDSSTLSSSLFASDVWFPSSGSSRVDFPRRAPCTRILPPLQLPSPKDVTDYSSDDIWPRKCLNKFSLPPIELPPVKLVLVRSKRREELSCVESVGSVKEVRCKRKVGVSKTRRRRMCGRSRGADVRRMVGCLMRRAIREGGNSLRETGSSPALQHVLTTIREAWNEPTSLKDRSCVLSRMYVRNSAKERDNTTERDSERESDTCAMMTRTQLAELPPRPDASPGLMRRRYSVPETIMRKYRLAQQNSDSEECGPPDGGSLATFGAGHSPSTSRDTPRSAGESPRHLRRDRELMRKSALLRRMRVRPPDPPLSPPSCRCETRSLEGSRDELSVEPHLDRKRQRRAPSVTYPCGLSRGAAISSGVDTTDALSDDFASAPLETTASTAPATPHTDEPRARDLSYTDSDALSTSASTAKETPVSLEIASSIERHFEGRVSARDPSVENEDRNASPSPPACAFDVLEVVVSESASSSPPEGDRPAIHSGASLSRRLPSDVSLDEYVSRVLMESLHSLSDRLEGVTASVGADRKLSVVEKEIKVRLQNAAVNTIVHLSPTSNNQIIFGNEELCDEEEETELCDIAQHRGISRDECNNPRAPALREDNNNASPSAFDAVIQHDNVNRAVLQQIQKLFRDELHNEGGDRDDIGAVSHIEISSVDAFLSGGAGADTISVMTSEAGSPVGGVGTGNYFRDLELALVPRRCAVPHSASMEVNTSSSEDAEADPLGSDATSLVDSLDDPDSPRSVLLRPRGRPAPARSSADVPDPTPDSAPPRSAAFFVRIRDDTPETDRVAECMPERIRQKLHRRHRKRELRMECARRGKVRQLRDELERRRAAEIARNERALEREAVALTDALLDDVIAKVARDEYLSARLDRRRPCAGAASLESVDRRPAKPEPAPRRDREERREASSDERARRAARHQGRGRSIARPPRRIYQKSEIREGDQCIEILEILEYSAASRSSAETTPTDDSAERTRTRRSRIPVPVPPSSADHMRLTGGDSRPPPPLAELLMRALAPPAPPPAPPEPRSRSNSLRFKRVFDMIPEERGGPGGDSPSPAEEPKFPPAGASLPAPSPPAPLSPPRRALTRSAGTSPPTEMRRQRSQTTMTSPSIRSAATSPWRPPPPPPREGSRERSDRRSNPTKNERDRRQTRDDGGAAEGTHDLSEERLRRNLAEAGDFRPATGDVESGRRGSGAESGGSSSSDRSEGSLLCSLAPRWLSAHARQRRRPRRPPLPRDAPAPAPAPASVSAGGWSVTVAGSCRAALPADVEMRLRFPHERRAAPVVRHQECACAACALPPSPAAPALPPPRTSSQDRLTLTMKKEAQDSSILATKSVRKSSEQQLPDLETYRAIRASRTKVNSSVKTRRGYSLHCWLPDDESTPIRVNNGLSVLGCAIIPELKPRVPTMSERDLTRVYTPRHFLRS